MRSVSFLFRSAPSPFSSAPIGPSAAMSDDEAERRRRRQSSSLLANWAEGMKGGGSTLQHRKRTPARLPPQSPCRSPPTTQLATGYRLLVPRSTGCLHCSVSMQSREKN